MFFCTGEATQFAPREAAPRRRGAGGQPWQTSTDDFSPDIFVLLCTFGSGGKTLARTIVNACEESRPVEKC